MSHDAHGGKKESIIKIAFNMMMACLLSGAIIAGVYASTADAAKQTKEKAERDAMSELVEGATFVPITDGKEESEKWFAAMKDGKQVAYILPASWKGYEGIIEMVAAIDMDGKVIKYQILAHRETPGLGDKALEPKFIAQFKGKEVKDLEVVKVPDPTKIQALTGATITTRAVANGVKRAAEEVIEFQKTRQK